MAEKPERMEHKRLMELLAYAQVCFRHCTSPFASPHLLKKNVLSSECVELSHQIADLFDTAFFNEGVLETKELLEQAEKEFMETQKE